MSNKLVAISASRLKVLKDCSWLYWCKYGPTKLPDKTNKGALSGSCCHTIFECLLNPRHRWMHAEVVKEPATIRNVPAIQHYVKRYVAKHGMDKEDLKLIDAMICVGLMYDFYCVKGQGQEVAAETKFDIINESPKYRITGFIDKTAKYLAKNLVRIVDYKSSKRQFEGSDLTGNVQAKIYSLAARTMHPDLSPIVEFIFLQFPEKPVQRLRFNDTQLQEFEQYLGQVSTLINNYSLKDAVADFAADKPMPKEGFSGPLMCGFAKKPGELKKDGNPKWACIYKFPFDYFSLCNDKDEVVRSSFEDNFQPDESKGEYVIKKRYAGVRLEWDEEKTPSKGLTA